MGKPRKKHVLQSVVFSFFPPSLPRHKRPPYVWFFRGFPPLRLGKPTQTQPNLIGGHATNPEETVNQVSSRAFEIKDFHWGEQIVEKRMESKSEYSKHVSFRVSILTSPTAFQYLHTSFQHFDYHHSVQLWPFSLKV